MSDITIIKFLLIIITLAVCTISLVLILLLKRIVANSKHDFHVLDNKKIETNIKQLLAKGEHESAKSSALLWVDKYPYEPLAYWYLAKAYDQLGDYIEVKKNLLKLQKLSPSWNDSINPWLENTEKELKLKGVE